MNGYVRKFGKLIKVIAVPVDEKTWERAKRLKDLGEFNDRAREELLCLINRLEETVNQESA